MSATIVIINHGFANIASLCNALQHLQFEPKVITSKDDLSKINVKGFILPGVGSFNPAMKSLRERKLDHVIFDLLDSNIKGMGICLGMQMLANSSEEDDFIEPGLGVFPGSITKIRANNLPVPYISWMQTFHTQKSTNIDCILPVDMNGTFYYVHSYAYQPTLKDQFVAASYNYGDQRITAAIHRDCILGVQFHPEKSQSSGLTLLKNYFC